MTKGSAKNAQFMPIQNMDGKGRFERFLGEQRNILVGFLRPRTTNEADAQDAAQESMVRLLRYRDNRPAEAWKPLLYRIAINVAHDQARRERGRSAERQDMAVEDLPADEPALEDRLSDLQELAVIRELIMRLPTRRREIYLLNRIEGMSYSQIAAHCKISEKAVEKQIAKALKALRRGVGNGLDTCKERRGR
jgi:RNA polymerase sigma-70 factor (ECF subfamily)